MGKLDDLLYTELLLLHLQHPRGDVHIVANMQVPGRTEGYDAAPWHFACVNIVTHTSRVPGPSVAKSDTLPALPQPRKAERLTTLGRRSIEPSRAVTRGCSPLSGQLQFLREARNETRTRDPFLTMEVLYQ